MKIILNITFIVLLSFPIGFVFADDECEESDGLTISWGQEEERDANKAGESSLVSRFLSLETGNEGLKLRTALIVKATFARLEYEPPPPTPPFVDRFVESYESILAEYGIYIDGWIFDRVALGSGIRYGRNRSAELSVDSLTIPIEMLLQVTKGLKTSLGFGVVYYNVDHSIDSDDIGPPPFYIAGEEYSEWVGPSGSLELGVFLGDFWLNLGLEPKGIFTWHDHDITFSAISLGVGYVF